MQDYKESTDRLSMILLSEKNFEDYVRHHEKDFSELTLSEYLNELLSLYHTSKKQILDCTYIDINYGYQIFNGIKRKPARDLLLQIALSFPLTISETNHLLYYGSSKQLYPRVKRDAFFMFALHNHYTIDKTNQFLSSKGLDPLKAL